jgi:hypothetical protein
MATYRFTNKLKSAAQRDSDMACVPWNPETNEPLDRAGFSYQKWVEDGRPEPEAPAADAPDLP